MKKSKFGIIVICFTLLIGALPFSANSQVKQGLPGSTGDSISLLPPAEKPDERDRDYFKESVKYYKELASDPSAELTSELRDLIKKIAQNSDSWENKLTAIEQAVFAYWATEPWCIRDLAKFESWLKDSGSKLLPPHALAVIGDMLSAASACSDRFWGAQRVAQFYQPEEINKLYNNIEQSVFGGPAATPVGNLAGKVAQARTVIENKVKAKKQAKRKIAPGAPGRPCKPQKPNPNRPQPK